MNNIDNLDGEIWKRIPGFSHYEASNFGRVKSYFGYVGKVEETPQRILKPRINGRKYLDVCVSNDLGEPKHKLIHQLVILAFVGSRPLGMEVCHNDGNKMNNYLSNLRYDTQESNTLDAINQGQIKRGVECAASKLEEEEVVVIRKLYHVRGIGITLLSRIFGVSLSTIRRIVNCESWRHIDKYSYPEHRIRIFSNRNEVQ